MAEGGPARDWSFPLVRGFVRLYGLVKDATGRNLPGLGWTLRRVRSARVLEVHGLRFWLDPSIAEAYGRMVAGEWTEPETHVFITFLLDRAPGPVTLVDVGASVGAMAVQAAAHPNTREVFAFEPHPTSAAACRRSAELNGLESLHIRRMALSDGGEVRMRFDTVSHTGSALDARGEAVPGGTLDAELDGIEPPVILLIDVEGHEPAVLRGGASLLARARPVVIFEYNALSRAAYRLEEIQGILGPHYRIFRLRVDGRLDGRTEEAWNCVAVPRDSLFYSSCEAAVV